MEPVITPSNRRLEGHYIAMQIGFWAMYAGICGYQATLLQSRGFSNSQVGLVIAVRCLAGIVCQPLLGGFADRHPQVPLKHIVTLSLALSFAAGLVLLFYPTDLAGTLVIFAILGGFEISAYPLMDSMAIQYMNAGVPIRYSLGRGIGSLSFAITCVLLGIQVGHTGVESTLVTHAGLVLAEILLVATYPAFRAPPRRADVEHPRPQSTLSLLRGQPRFTLMLGAALLGITAVLPLSNFLVNIIESRGGDAAHLGLALFLMAGFELPTAFLFQRLLHRFGSARLLLISMVFCTLKCTALLVTSSFLGVLAAQPLQILGYGLFTPASVYFVNEFVPEADRVRGQTLMMVASNGMGGVLGSFLAGRALDLGASTPLGGANLMLVLCTGLGCLSILLAWLAVGGMRKKD